jgi:hypothetical protein
MDKEYARPNNVFMLKPDVDFGELYEALTDRLSRIESMAAARVGENEGENSYWCAIGAQATEGQDILDKLREIHLQARHR